MYNVSRGPSKFTVQSRRAGQLDPSFEQRNGKADPRQNMSFQSQAVPTFHQQQSSKRHDNRFYNRGDHQFTTNHLDIVKLLSDDWKQTERELLDYKRGKGNKVVEEHVCKEDNLRNFKPIDLAQLSLSQIQFDDHIS
ncbi:hypothetical protein BSL78_22044 [Apostichopus japonicus]|uniref:Uncharacterized protein n=1 Tax=Stichopus japonicus TaxID=307972 RepID=A0A2G8JZB9_STIJA|nr:hypothetical protein BSL78_22044 [Apostichopus japonicus]